MSAFAGGASGEPTSAAATKTSEDMRTLLAHEKKSSAPMMAGIPASDDEGTSSSDSEDEDGSASGSGMHFTYSKIHVDSIIFNSNQNLECW